MQRPGVPAWPIAALLLQCLAPSLAALMRRDGAATRSLLHSGATATNSSIREIQEKWDKMDDFLGVMFAIACKWSHGKDVNGLAAEKLKNGNLDRDGVKNFKIQTQARNVQNLKEACGRIVGSSQGKCRQGCASRWGAATGKRAGCDEKCVTRYESFEKNCKQKADHLKVIYESKLSSEAATQRCRAGHCSEFPTAWMLDTEADMKKEVDSRCSSRCTEDQIRLGCKRKWLLQVDFLKANITSTCFAEGQVKACFDKEKASASAASTQCTASGKSSCATQYAKCKQEGKTDATFKDAEAFCISRLKMCEAQVAKHCLEEHKQSLQSAKSKCEDADHQALGSCEARMLSEKESETITTCVSDATPKCSEECHGKCDIEAMNKCLNNLSKHDETELFCNDLWRMLQESSEVDSATGDPAAS